MKNYQHDYNTGMGQSGDLGKGENYHKNKRRSKGHRPDSRFDEGSVEGIDSAKIVRPNHEGYSKGRFFDYLRKK